MNVINDDGRSEGTTPVADNRSRASGAVATGSMVRRVESDKVEKNSVFCLENKKLENYKCAAIIVPLLRPIL